MFTMAIGLRGRTNQDMWVRARAVRLAALLGTLILMSVAVNALTMLADSKLRQRSSVAGDCPVMAEKADRLACYDNHASRPAPHPFRGANAPALSHSL